MSLRFAKKRAKKILREYYPEYLCGYIDLKQALKGLGITLKEERLERGVNAITVVKNSKPYIFVDKRIDPIKKRYLIAYELGHFVMHSSEFRVNKRMSLCFTDNKIGEEDEKDIEANQFALELLLPKELIEHYFELNPVCEMNEKVIQKMAKVMRVNPEVLGVRLVKLKEV